MAKTVQIKCDSCAKDLTYRSNCVDYYLTLSSESKASLGGIVTAMMIYPAIDDDLFFCGLSCLDRWTARRQFTDKLYTEWSNAWRAENGEHDTNGKLKWYSDPPDDVKKARDAEIEARVAAEFPPSA